jgi:solute carrier family 13 (sodium-dependent dicarboxylate transporter), member 2/3/5
MEGKRPSENAQGSWILLAGLMAVGILLALPPPEGMTGSAKQAATIGALMAFLWVSELVPLAATALLPLAAFPLLGITSLEKTAQAYAHPLIFLFLGGFMLSAAIERWKLHQRLAIFALSIAGRRPDALVLAMMCVTAFLSLWVSNTATAMVMVPIAAALLGPERGEGREAGSDAFGAALMLGIAFAATIGGMGSLIGTPPNALFAAYVQTTYGLTIGFGQWMLIGLPIVCVLLPLSWLLLTRLAFRLPITVPPSSTFEPASTAMSRPERIVTGVLAATALAWITRPFLDQTFGWTALSDAGIAIAAVLALFGLPARWVGTSALLEWKDVEGIRWDVLILFGGGLALADAVSSTGLAAWIGAQLEGLSGLPVMLVVLVMMIIIVYLGELASNTAVAAVFLPVAGAAAMGLGARPLEVVLPIALAASLGFMLPVATPPNAIVYGTGAITPRQMLKAGAVLDVVSILVVYVLAIVLGPMVFETP